MKKNTQITGQLQLVENAQEMIRELVRKKMQNAAIELIHGLFDEEIERLCGPKWSHKKTSKARRGGWEKGSVKVGGQRLSVKRPRARKGDDEVDLESYSALQDFDILCESVMAMMINGVSTRNYDGLLDELSGGLGLKKSSVSKAFIKGSQQCLDEINGRDLSQYRFAAIMIDGIEFAGRTVVSVLGITDQGKKLNIGLKEGSTENADVVKDLIQELIDRGLDRDNKMLFVIDGSKALKSAIVRVFGKDVAIQRCIRHKERNILSYLPKKNHGEFRRKWKTLHGVVSYEQAKYDYKKLLAWLGGLNHEAKNSLLEADMDTLTVIRLNLPDLLRKTLASTNPIESCFSGVRYKTNRVKNWKGEKQISRWVAASLLEVEKKYRTIRGFKEIPILFANLNLGIECQEKIA